MLCLCPSGSLVRQGSRRREEAEHDGVGRVSPAEGPRRKTVSFKFVFAKAHEFSYFLIAQILVYETLPLSFDTSAVKVRVRWGFANAKAHYR